MTSTARHGRWVKLRGPLQIENTYMKGTEHGTIIHERPDGLGRISVRIRWTDGRESEVFDTEIIEEEP